MRKKLIAAIVVALISLAAAVAVVFFMENKSPFNEIGENGGESFVETTDEPKADVTAEPTEETVGISLPTENSDEVTPELTIAPEDFVPAETSDSDETQDPNATEDPDENATPEIDF